MKNIIQINHPAVKNLVTKLRDISTEPPVFRKTLSQVVVFLLYEALKNEKTEMKEIKIWIGKGDFPVIREEKFVFIPILRAGLPMLEGALQVLPQAQSGFLAIKRNEETLESKVYYDRVPNLKGKTAIILDPMVATGGSLINAITVVKQKSPESIISLNVVGAPEGIRNVSEKHPDVRVYIAQIDETLDSNGYIIPGLGDAGDRAYNT